MKNNIIMDGKFKVAGEMSRTLETEASLTKKGDERMKVENVKVINITDKIKKTITNINNITDIKLGEVYYARLSGENHIQCGNRPVIVIQNNMGNKFSTNVQVIPLTTSKNKTSMPTHVELPAIECGLPQDSIAQCEMQTIIDKSALREYVTKIPSKYMGKIGSKALINTPSLVFLPDTEILRLMGMIREKNRIVKSNTININPNPKTAA